MGEFLSAYQSRALVVAVVGDNSSGDLPFSRSLTQPVMDLEIFELIDEILFADRRGGEVALHYSHY